MIGISQPIIGEEEIEAVVQVMRSGVIVQGPRTADLEARFAEYCGTKYAVAFNSGTAALHAGLYGMGIKEDDEVITTPFTFVASANPILMQRAKVVFADISETDFCIDPEAVAAKITDKTKAIVPVDLYGQIYDYAAIKQLADQHSLQILEDACQAVGSELDGKRAGNFGNAAAFSLYATKNMMCGEGGMLTTNDEEVVEKSKMLRHHGQSEKVRYEYFDMGYNYRLPDLAAAIALVQLGKIDQFNQTRIRNAGLLHEGLKDIQGLMLPVERPNGKHVYHQFTIRITPDFGHTREELIQHLQEKEIGCGIYYPKPLHLHTAFASMGHKEGDFPVAEKLAKQVLSLPVHPSVSESDVSYIIDNIRRYATGA